MELAYTGSFFEFHPPAIIGVKESIGRGGLKRQGEVEALRARIN